ncbi:MAG: hypothetical protein EOP09_08975 [Proteobacteria bacterium]|nr:MAG: hypothetical protein EOP09_08975 [Pseudomonadota bacterium]
MPVATSGDPPDLRVYVDENPLKGAENAYKGECVRDRVTTESPQVCQNPNEKALASSLTISIS